ncbi:MAG TPA: hypothetical protein P5572_00080 [Phycisphaerae bacterium]|nr:hypothetical protein [Phycisphaerae bacterium]
MRSICRTIVLLIIAQLPAAARAEHPAVHWQPQDDGSIVARVGAQSFAFRPELTLLFTADDPKLAMRPADIKRVSYNVPTWHTGVTRGADGVRNVDTSVAGGDGLDPSILAGDTKGRTCDYLRAAPRAVLQAEAIERDGATVAWKFASHPVANISASVDLGAPNGPKVEITLRARRAGWFSIGYTGAPAVAAEELEWLYQPLIWHARRMPDRSYATAAFECTIPATLVQRAGTTFGVVVDPAMLPFQPLPRLDNSQFAVALRDDAGQARPMAFAPLLGGAGSKMAAGDTRTLTATLYVQPAALVNAYESIARDICGFADHRHNLDISLNQTLANMVAYGMSPQSRFNAELRGCAYDTDVPQAVKNVSALHPLSAALVLDDEAIYRERALPIWEYLLSREKLLFNLDPSVRTQSPSDKMLGPCANVSELAVLYAISGGRDYVSRAYAETLYGSERTLNLDVPKRGNTWPAAMELYAATGDARYAQRRDAELTRYLRQRIATAPTDFSDRDAGGMFFWTSYAPLWMELYEAWTQTHDPHLLAASAAGARDYTLFTWMLPEVPAETVHVNPGGHAPHYSYLKGKGLPPMPATEHDVPAWWVDALGLTPESSGTASGHRGIFMATYAPWMLRVAHDAEVPFLRDVARSAVIGRYRNFPGYHINTARTDVYMAADYPLRDHHELSYNSFHYNHVWPMIAMLLDYLVSDVYAASDGAIDFPAHYAEGYAYLRQRIYGDRPGRFYDRNDVYLWMPRDVVAVSDPQLNYISARTSDEVLLAFTNQSDAEVHANVTLDADRCGLGPADHAVKVWRENEPADSATLHAGAVAITVAPRGITAIAVQGCTPQPLFQQRVLADRGEPLGPAAHQAIAAGDCRAMLLTMGRTLTTAYVYSRALPGAIRRIIWEVRPLGSAAPWSKTVDASYPFEFSCPLDAAQAGLELRVTVEPADGEPTTSDPVILRR